MGNKREQETSVIMTKFTERLLQAGIIVVILYVGYQFSVQTVLALLNANHRAAQAEQRAEACKTK